MGYYIKRIITIKDSTPEKLKTLANVIDECTGFNFGVYEDHIDDANWNSGAGISGIFDDDLWNDVAEKLPDIEFVVLTNTEDHAIVEYNCFNGYSHKTTIRETDDWYKYQAPKILESSPGVNPNYCRDFGMGDDYPIPYGDVGEHLKQGVPWWTF